jgi:hypothetical protein
MENFRVLTTNITMWPPIAISIQLTNPIFDPLIVKFVNDEVVFE